MTLVHLRNLNRKRRGVLYKLALFLPLAACASNKQTPTLLEEFDSLADVGAYEESVTREGNINIRLLGNAYSTEAWVLSLAFVRAAERVDTLGMTQFEIVSLGSNGAVSKDRVETEGAICKEDGYVQLPGASLVVEPLASVAEAQEHSTVVSVAKVMDEIAPLALGRQPDKLSAMIAASSSPCPDLFAGGQRFMPWEFFDVLSQPSVDQETPETLGLGAGKSVTTGKIGAAGIFPSFTSAERAIYLTILELAEEVVKEGGDLFWVAEAKAWMNCELALTRPEIYVDVYEANSESQPDPDAPTYSALSVIEVLKPIVSKKDIARHDRIAARDRNTKACAGDGKFVRNRKLVDISDELHQVLPNIGRH